jgi:hypothetical protein
MFRATKSPLSFALAGADGQDFTLGRGFSAALSGITMPDAVLVFVSRDA